jgi:hypothetical protein
MAFCFFFLLCTANAQTGKDSIQTDTLRLYHSIERFAKKKKFTYQLYKAAFHLPDTTKKSKPKYEAKVDHYERYGGRIVRNIFIETLDPFGYKARDTSAIPHSFIQKGGNFLHNRSSAFTIKNQLLVRKGEPLDPLKLKESERLVRQAQYVRDVVVTVKPVGNDSVDIYFREQDLWSIGMGVGITGSSGSILFKDKNFAGLSHQVETYWYYQNDTKKNVVLGNYTIPYLRNTYMTVTGYFSTDKETYLNGVSINRPFYSTLTKWAWGVDYLFHGRTDSAGVIDAPRIAAPIHYNDVDVWLGRAFPLSISNSFESRSTKLITAAHVLNRTYTQRLPSYIDTSNLYFNSRLYLGAVGISNRTYYRDYYIYRYGVPEDVPSGRFSEILFGYEEGMNTGRIYAGGLTGFGEHINHIGYLSLIGGYGSYFRNGTPEQSVVTGSLLYFSDLLELSNWRLRQFVKMEAIYGINRKSGESININDRNGIRGFNDASLSGTNKFLVTLQSQLYLPYSLLGFRFAPFIYCSFGMLGSEVSPFYENRVYQGYGIGLLIKNELLTTSTFQVSIGIYPYIRSAGNSLFLYNPIKTYNFGFRDFDIQKPGVVGYE